MSEQGKNISAETDKKKVVLVVDDSPTVCSFVSKALMANNLVPIALFNIEDALRHKGFEVADVVVTDIHLPGMSGLDAIEMLRRDMPEVPVIAMTAGVGEDDWDETLMEARRAGADVVLKKPFKAERLIEKIHYALGLRNDAGRQLTRVLVVDDSATQCLAIAAMFPMDRFRVFTAGSAEEAMASPDIVGVDLVVCDIFMPGAGGIQCIADIRATWPNVRVIGMSAGLDEQMSSEKAAEAAGRIGADVALEKPFQQERLMAAVADAFGG